MTEDKQEKTEESTPEEPVLRNTKSSTGYTVMAYINRLRVEKAQKLLMASELSIDEIAYQTGFESPKYFYRVFKSIAGESPANIRRKYKR